LKWCTYDVVYMHLGEIMAKKMQALQDNSRLLKALIHRNC